MNLEKWSLLGNEETSLWAIEQLAVVLVDDNIIRNTGADVDTLTLGMKRRAISRRRLINTPVLQDLVTRGWSGTSGAKVLALGTTTHATVD